MKAIGKLVIYTILGILRALAGGFVLSRLWAWFVVASLGLPPIGYLQAVGISLVICHIFGEQKISSMTAEDWKKKKAEDEDVATVVGRWLVLVAVYYPLILGVAWAWHQFIPG